jgi:alpha-glucosidase
MLTALARLRYQGIQNNEHLWIPVDETLHDLVLAGSLLGSEVVRVRLLRTTQLGTTRYQLADGGAGTLPYHSWAVAKGDEQWPIGADEQAAHAIIEPYVQGFAASTTELRFTQRLASEERIFGLGERTSSMNKRGQAFPIWNIDPHKGHNAQTVTMYTSIPFYLGLTVADGRAYGVLIDHMGKIEMDIGKTARELLTATLEGDTMVVYFFMGPTSARVMQQFTELTGRMPLPPRWATGYHQCRWGYKTQERALEVANMLRERRHPCDALWLDIDYMDSFRDFTWNSDGFPRPEAMAEQLHEEGFHLVTIVDPGLKIDEDYGPYKEGMAQDLFCRMEDGALYTGNVWPGTCAFPDFSQEKTRIWWGNLYKGMVEQGLDGAWNDMNEPALTNSLMGDDAPPLASNTMPNDVLHRAGGDHPTETDGQQVSHQFFHNAYGMEMARATHDGLLRLRPNTRPFVLTRSGSTGIQRYAAIWTGDNWSRWADIIIAIPMCLNLSMSGVPFVGIDIGGFWSAADGELLARFAQLGAFLPFCRNHNAIGMPDQEPWAFGEPYESAYRTAIETRYRLLPYLYTLFHEASVSGAPIIRPLYYHYPNDEQACDMEDEYLVGDTLLTAPVYQPGAISRDVYLPAGLWFDYWTNAEYPGNGTSEIAAPLDRWPLLVRGNSILPSGPLMQYVEQRPIDPLTFTCFMATDGETSYTHYEDDDSSFAYQQGAFAQIAVNCRASEGFVTVEIQERFEHFRPQREAYEIIVHVGGRTVQQRVNAGQGRVILRL